MDTKHKTLFFSMAPSLKASKIVRLPFFSVSGVRAEKKTGTLDEKNGRFILEALKLSLFVQGDDKKDLYFFLLVLSPKHCVISGGGLLMCSCGVFQPFVILNFYGRTMQKCGNISFL